MKKPVKRSFEETGRLEWLFNVQKALQEFIEMKKFDRKNLDNDGIRVVRGLGAIWHLCDEAIDACEPNSSDLESLNEAKSIIVALTSGRTHPALEYFLSVRKTNRPKKDTFAVRRIYLAVAAKEFLVSEGMAVGEARKQIAAAIGKLPGAFTATQIENFENRTDDKFAKSALREILEPHIRAKREADPNSNYSAIEALKALWPLLGPNG